MLIKIVIFTIVLQKSLKNAKSKKFASKLCKKTVDKAFPERDSIHHSFKGNDLLNEKVDALAN